MDGTSKTLSTPFGTFLREVSAEFASTRASCFPSNSLPAAEWRKLFKPVVPMEGESLRSLVARACKLNHLPNSWGLLQYVGLPNRSRVRVAEDSNIDPAELAHAIGVDDKEVRTRRYEALGRGHGSFFGLDVNYAAIETRIRRFSVARKWTIHVRPRFARPRIQLVAARTAASPRPDIRYCRPERRVCPSPGHNRTDRS